MKRKLFIALTYGDPSGIGPEILQKTLNNWNFNLIPVVIGIKDYLKYKKNKLKNTIFYFNDLKRSKVKRIKPGKLSSYGGQHAYECIKKAVLLVKSKKLNAIVTGPVSKHAVRLARIKFLGQTEEIARLCGLTSDKVIMLFVASDLRVALYTRHIPLRMVSNMLSKGKLKRFVLLLNKELKKWFHIRNPKIGVLGLNPHAGEEGAFGNEDLKIISPVVKNLSEIGIKIFGPLSPDATLAEAGRSFILRKKQKYDVIVALYHDQVLPMFKAVTGFKGVNVTLGLPFLRVSPDHGTAFDIAGKNKASNESFVSAIKLVESIIKI